MRIMLRMAASTPYLTNVRPEVKVVCKLGEGDVDHDSYVQADLGSPCSSERFFSRTLPALDSRSLF